MGSEQRRGPDLAKCQRWAERFRGWHYFPTHVIAPNPGVPEAPDLQMTDCPTVFQLPGNRAWCMSFIGFDGRGYRSFIAQSDDLVHWTQPRLAMDYGPEGAFDHGGCVLGAYLYTRYDIAGPRTLRRRQGRYWSLYGAYPRQGGYELRPGYQGLANSDDGLIWRRAQEAPTLSVFDPDCGTWEKDCIYQPWLVEYRRRFYDFYNAAEGGLEQTGVAFSSDLHRWKRYDGNPVLRLRPDGYDAVFCSDPKVYRDGDHWMMWYFGVGRNGAHIMAAFSVDLLHWTALPEPLYRAGGHPGGLDRQFAHKTSLVYDPSRKCWFLFYCAVGDSGRGIGLLTSRPVEGA